MTTREVEYEPVSYEEFKTAQDMTPSQRAMKTEDSWGELYMAYVAIFYFDQPAVGSLKKPKKWTWKLSFQVRRPHGVVGSMWTVFVFFKFCIFYGRIK